MVILIIVLVVEQKLRGNIMNNKSRQVIIVRKDLGMSVGKMAAQASHASMAFLIQMIKDHENGYEVMLFDINEEVYEWMKGAFTKTICEAKNRNHLMKAVKYAEELGLKEGKDFFLIKDNCYTELEPEDEDGRTLTAIGFRPMTTETAHKISKKFQLFNAEMEKPKKGKWISHSYEEDEIKTAMWAYEECSVCHKGVIEPTRYCPMCGAEMER